MQTWNETFTPSYLVVVHWYGFWSIFNYLSFVSFSKCFIKLSLAVWWSTMVTLWLWYECKTAIFTSTSVLSFHSDVGVRVSRSSFWAIFYSMRSNSGLQLKSMDSENEWKQRKYIQMVHLQKRNTVIAIHFVCFNQCGRNSLKTVPFVFPPFYWSRVFFSLDFFSAEKAMQ